VLSWLRALDRRAVGAHDAHAAAGDLGDVAVLEVDQGARHLQQRGGVRGGVMTVFAEPEQQGRAVARDDDALRLLFREDGDGVGADQFGAGGAHGGEEVGLRLQLVLDEVGDDLGVGLRGEDVAEAGQAGLDLAS
jgi:hypothetical protein